MKRVDFTRAERMRLFEVCRALGTSYEEFIHFATMRAVDECEGIAREIQAANCHTVGPRAWLESDHARDDSTPAASAQAHARQA